MSDFHTYIARRRPRIEEAYNLRLYCFLAGVPAADRAGLLQSLQAGKKIRGCLSCLVCEGLGGPVEQAIPRAVAIEMIQAATLLHDDFVDQDRLRGGRAAVWTIEGARRTVLIGDVIFAAAIKMMADLGARDGREVADAIARVSRGALKEPLDAPALAEKIESEGPRAAPYDEIVRLKTAELFGTACTLGALAAGLGGPVSETCRSYGLSVGEAYQIADDLKEVRHCLATGLIDARHATGIAPAVLRFAPEARMLLVDALKGGRPEIDAGGRALLAKAARLMEEAIDARRGAAALIGGFPCNGYSEVVRKAPGEIITIFNESL